MLMQLWINVDTTMPRRIFFYHASVIIPVRVYWFWTYIILYFRCCCRIFLSLIFFSLKLRKKKILAVLACTLLIYLFTAGACCREHFSSDACSYLGPGIMSAEVARRGLFVFICRSLFTESMVPGKACKHLLPGICGCCASWVMAVDVCTFWPHSLIIIFFFIFFCLANVLQHH